MRLLESAGLRERVIVWLHDRPVYCLKWRRPSRVTSARGTLHPMKLVQHNLLISPPHVVWGSDHIYLTPKNLT